MDDSHVHRPEQQADDSDEQGIDEFEDGLIEVNEDDYPDWDDEGQMQFDREDCKHDWSRSYGGGPRWCGKCSAYDGDKDRSKEYKTMLNAAEEEFGAFGAGRVLWDLRKKAGTHGLAYYLIADADGRWLHAHLAGACYAALQDH